MKNLEDEQRKMRERWATAKPKKANSTKNTVPNLEDSADVNELRKRIAKLEAENAELRLQIANLMKESQPVLRHDLSERERRHLFFKYSNETYLCLHLNSVQIRSSKGTALE